MAKEEDAYSSGSADPSLNSSRNQAKCEQHKEKFTRICHPERASKKHPHWIMDEVMQICAALQKQLLCDLATGCLKYPCCDDQDEQIGKRAGCRLHERLRSRHPHAPVSAKRIKYRPLLRNHQPVNADDKNQERKCDHSSIRQPTSRHPPVARPP